MNITSYLVRKKPQFQLISTVRVKKTNHAMLFHLLQEPEPPAPGPLEKKEPTTPTDPNSGFTPNLARFMHNTATALAKHAARPDSSMSFSSSATNR